MEWGPMASYWVWGPCSQMPKWHRRFQLLPDLCQRTHALRRGIVHYLNRHGTFFVWYLGRNDRTGCRQRGVQHRSNKRFLGVNGEGRCAGPLAGFLRDGERRSRPFRVDDLDAINQRECIKHRRAQVNGRQICRQRATDSPSNPHVRILVRCGWSLAVPVQERFRVSWHLFILGTVVDRRVRVFFIFWVATTGKSPQFGCVTLIQYAPRLDRFVSPISPGLRGAPLPTKIPHPLIITVSRNIQIRSSLGDEGGLSIFTISRRYEFARGSVLNAVFQKLLNLFDFQILPRIQIDGGAAVRSLLQ